MKKIKTITILLTAVYIVLLIVALQHNTVHIGTANAPLYIGRHTLKTEKP
jgi:hypothetical protein